MWRDGATWRDQVADQGNKDQPTKGGLKFITLTMSQFNIEQCALGCHCQVQCKEAQHSSISLTVHSNHTYSSPLGPARPEGTGGQKGMGLRWWKNTRDQKGKLMHHTACMERSSSQTKPSRAKSSQVELLICTNRVAAVSRAREHVNLQHSVRSCRQHCNILSSRQPCPSPTFKAPLNVTYLALPS